LLGDPNIEETLVVLVVAPKMEVVLVGVLKIEGAQVVFVGVLKIEGALSVIVGVLKIEGALVLLVGVLKIDAWLVVIVEFPKILVVLVELIGVPNIEVFVVGISKICELLAVTGNFGDSSFSGVIGSDIIGVGLSETWEVVSVTLLSTVVDIALKSSAVLTVPKLDDTVEESTGSLTIGTVFCGCEKLNDTVTVVVGMEVEEDLVSDSVVFKTLSLDVLKLNVENDAVPGFVGFELNLNVVNVASFSGTVSCLFFDLFSAPNPENILEDSEGFGVSKFNGISFGLSILFLIEPAKSKFTVPVRLVFCTVVSDFVVDTWEKLNGIFSFASVVPEIISKVELLDTILLELLKFIGVAVNDFKLKSTGSLVETAVLVTLLANNGLTELKTIGSLVKAL